MVVVAAPPIQSVPYIEWLVEVAWVNDWRPVKALAPENVFAPEKVLLLAKSVVEAMVMSALPLNEMPLMRRAVANVVAVLALPPMLRVEVAALYALLLASSATSEEAVRPVNHVVPENVLSDDDAFENV